MPDIVLATLNARYSHAALGLRYLHANLGELRERAVIREYTIKRPPLEIVEAILAEAPRVVGLGVYIWNVVETARVLSLLKTVAPEIAVVLGGPEVSHEWQEQDWLRRADYLITGPGELSFAQLAGALLAGERPTEKVISGLIPDLTALASPYPYYSDEDIAHRLIYVEASRGCPFKCEFCLSALDKTAWPFPLEAFLAEMDALYRRGARCFKFVDRTFNLNPRSSARILEFFLERLDDRLFLHFEVVPDHLPEGLKALIGRFPKGSLQLEIGIQTFDTQVQALIQRKQDNARSEANLAWLRQHSQAHLHVDLIVGLPGEDLEGFGRGFDRLWALGPHEIQVGILKRLRGAPIARHTLTHGMRYNPLPPYEVLATDRLSFTELRRMARFARYWDLLANSGRFPHTLPRLLGEAPFQRFLTCSDWLHGRLGGTAEIAMDRWFPLLYAGLRELFDVSDEEARACLAADFALSGIQGVPRFLRAGAAPGREPPTPSRTPAAG